jgi:HSP20 family protein
MNTVRCGYRPMFPSFFDEVMERAANPEAEIVYKAAANVREDEKMFAIELALPGFEKEEISMKLEKDLLTISAGRQKNESDVKYTRSEFGFNSKYSRTFILPESIDSEAIAAEYRNGILTVSIPKKEEQKPLTKEIAIA